MKLTGKFLLMMIGIPFIILLITSAVTFSIQQNILRKEILLQQKYLVGDLSNGIYAEIQGLQQKTKDIATLPVVKRLLNDPPSKDYNREEFNANPHYEEYLLTLNEFVDESVVLVYVVSEETGSLTINQWIDLPDQYDGRVKDYYMEPVKRNGVYVSEPYMNAPGTDNPTAVTVSYPIKDNGKLIGVSAIDIGLGGITRLSEEMAAEFQAEIGIFTTNGSVIYHPAVQDDDRIYNFSEFLELMKVTNLDDAMNLIYSGDEGSTIVNFEELPSIYVIAAPITGTDWMAIVAFPIQTISMKIIRSVLPITIISSVVLLLTLAAVGFILNKTVIRNILTTSGYLKTIASGDLTIDVDPRLLTRKDEIGILGKSVNEMTRNLQDIVGKVTSAANYIASGSNQVSDSSQMLSSGATEQAASAEQVSSSMEEMSSNISQNADNSSQTEKIAIKAARDARESGETVKEAVEAMGLIANKITIIEEISRSTNLLALNAAIEAARAGEHGKGFAVVAAEVRKLAEQSQKAAGEITELASKTVELSQGSGERLTKLVPDIEKTAELVEEISAASNEQQTGVDQITSAIHQLDKIIQSNASSSEELASTSEELAAQAEQLKETIQYFKISKDQHIERTSEPAREWTPPVQKKKEVKAPSAAIQETKETGITISGNNLDSETEKIYDDDFESF